jgi:hypothetical protein
VSSLITAINATSGLSVTTTTGDTSTPAAFIDTIAGEQTNTTISLTFGTWTQINKPQFRWPLDSGQVSTGNDTIDLSASVGGSKYHNPLRDGDEVFFVIQTGGSLPSPLVANTTYYVKNANAQTFQLAATAGGAAINLTTAGSAFFICSTTINPGATFWNYVAELGSEPFRPVSSAQLRSVRYFTAGRTRAGAGTGTLTFREDVGLMKYDSQAFYRAGMPAYRETTNPSPAAQVTSASQTDCKGTFNRVVTNTFDHPYYDYNYRYIDKAGNIIDGAMHGEYDSGTLYATPQVGAWLLNLSATSGFPWLISRLGFNSNYAIKNTGSTSALTFTVTDGYGNSTHTMQVGDIAYFWDARQARFIQREVTARTASTFTIAATSLDQQPQSPNYDDGLTPTVNPFAAFSANLRVSVWRTIGTGSANAAKYLVAELPWNPVYTAYYDDSSDTQIQLNGPLIEKPYEPTLPPASRFLTVYNSQLICGGDDANPLTVSFEDVETPEGMPLGTHSFDLSRPVRGMSPCGPVLVCGDDQKLHSVSGDLAEFKFRVEEISGSLGIWSHESMKLVEEGLLFFESTLGPYMLVGGSQLQPLGVMKYLDGRTASRVEPYFTADYSREALQPAFQRANAVVLPKDKLYILFVPLEDPSKLGFAQRAGNVSTGSLAFVYDYGRGEWFRWAGIDYSSVCEQNGTLHFAHRRYTGFVTDTDRYLEIDCGYGRMVRNKGRYSYSDHDLPLTWQWQSHWETLGKPAQFKRAMRARLTRSSALLANPTSVTLRQYVDFDTANLALDTTIAWDTRKDYKVKLASETCRGIMLELGAASYYEPFNLSAWEMELASDFREVMKE